MKPLATAFLVCLYSSLAIAAPEPRILVGIYYEESSKITPMCGAARNAMPITINQVDKKLIAGKAFRMSRPLQISVEGLLLFPGEQKRRFVVSKVLGVDSSSVKGHSKLVKVPENCHGFDKI